MSSAVGEEVNGRVRSTMICAVPTQPRLRIRSRDTARGFRKHERA
jgi:hypothetical protein